jgi:hypothetical protein
MNPIVLFLLTGATACVVYLLFVFVVVGKKK